MENFQLDNRSYQDELNVFINDKKRFLGEYQMSDYTINRKYINGDGKQLRLLYTQLIPKRDPIATICIIHGIADHTGPFMNVGQAFCLKGYAVHMVDLRGFGYSGGARGCSTLHQLLQDVGTLLQHVSPQLPLFLYGHCLGALTCLLFTILNPQVKLSGIICTSSLLAFPSDGRFTWLRLKFLKSAGKVLEDLVINSLVNPTALTKKTQYMKEISGDRLATPFMGLNMASSLIQGANYVKAYAYQVRVPLLIIHGKDDTVVSYTESISFYERCGSTEKSLKLFDKGMHELQNDSESLELQSMIQDWLTRRMSRSYALQYIEKKKLIGKKRLIFIILLIVLWHLGILYKLRQMNVREKWIRMRTTINALIEQFIE